MNQITALPVIVFWCIILPLAVYSFPQAVLLSDGFSSFVFTEHQASVSVYVDFIAISCFLYRQMYMFAFHIKGQWLWFSLI